MIKSFEGPMNLSAVGIAGGIERTIETINRLSYPILMHSLIVNEKYVLNFSLLSNSDIKKSMYLPNFFNLLFYFFH